MADTRPPAAIRLPRDESCTHEAFHEAALYELLAHDDRLVTMPPPTDNDNPYGPEQNVDADRAGVLHPPSYDRVYEAQRHRRHFLTPFLHNVLRATPPGLGVSGLSARSLRKGAFVTTRGGCGSDLFLQCVEPACRGDRVVIEVKGPTADMNQSPTTLLWQTETYEGYYASHSSEVCSCLGASSPYFVILDARDRTKQSVIAGKQKVRAAALANWAWLGYSDAFAGVAFEDSDLVDWLLWAGQHA